jgi:predicted SprT family Zn-dependent metalloprotease
MNLGDALALGRRLLDEHGLQDWSLVLDRAKRRAGVCRPGRKEIGLSGPLTALHSEAEVRDTILHEVAHALVGPRHGHDAVWRATALRIGSSGERCTSAEAPAIDGDWVGVCRAGHRVTRHRRPDRPASCRTCSRSFDADHLITWTHRGRSVPMSAAYVQALERLSQPALPIAPTLVLRPGDRVRIVTPGQKYHGVAGTVVKRGRTRYHLRVPAGILTVPFALVEAA